MKFKVAAGAAALSLSLAACGSSTTTTTPTPGAAGTPTTADATTPSTTDGIVISKFFYSGKLTVRAGEKVSAKNQDKLPHTVTEKAATPAFDTGNIPGSGGTGTITAPTKAGSYDIICKYHERMKGTLVVEG